jgi:hypothetical protein
MRKPLALLLVAGGSLLYLLRRHDARRERVNLYYDDGSMVTLERGGSESERLLEIGRAALS